METWVKDILFSVEQLQLNTVNAKIMALYSHE